MKLSDLAKGRTVVCRFDDIDDSNSGTITEEPVWQPNPYDTDKEMLVVKLASEGLVYELRVRSQMVDAIFDAVKAAGAKSLEPGGFLGVTFVGFKGQLKLYKAVYELPDDDRCGCADPRGLDPIGVGELESDPDDPGDGEATW